MVINLKHLDTVATKCDSKIRKLKEPYKGCTHIKAQWFLENFEGLFLGTMPSDDFDDFEEIFHVTEDAFSSLYPITEVALNDNTVVLDYYH